jgi:2-dehydro-3-deoxyglucarate aldolase/4-hydroxy-2-oxoheptanedioate aldolase
MREKKVKRALRAGNVALGTLVLEFATTGIGRLAAGAGADFVVFDLEHTGWSVETVRTVLAAARPADFVPIVRVPATQYHFVARVLDVGALGVMVPMVESAEQARSIVQFAKYPPVGRRGCCFGVAHDDYTGGDVVAKMQSANAEGLLVAQIETAAGLESVEAIAAVPELDVLWIGQNDLTASLGIPGQCTHPRYLDAVRRVLEACARYGKAAGIMVGSVEEGRASLAQGFRCLAYWADLWIYEQALRQGLDALRQQ